MSRAALIGACYGAMHEGAALSTEDNENGVPSAWVSLLNDGGTILECARKLAEMHTR